MSEPTGLDGSPAAPGATPPEWPPGPNRQSPAEVWPPLAGLVANGTLSAAQAEAVRATLLTDTTPKPKRGRLIAEVGLYLGAALVLLGLLVYIGNQWGSLTKWSRGGLLTATALICIVVAIVIVSASSARWSTLREPTNDATRRLVSVLLTLAVAALGGALASVVGQAHHDCAAFGCTLSERASFFLPLAAAAAFAFGLYVVVRWLAPTPFSDLAWFGSALLLAGLLCAALADSGNLVVIVIGVVGFAWAVLAAATDILASRSLGLALGLGTAAVTAVIFAALGSGPHWIPLALLLIACVAAYIATAQWQYLGAAAVATVGGAIVYVNREVADSVTGFVLVVIIAGLLLVALGALAFVITSKRRDRHDKVETDLGETSTAAE